MRQREPSALARKVAKELPLYGEQMRWWQKAVANVDRLNTRPNRAVAAASTAQLVRSMRGIGLNLPVLAGEVGTSPAEEEKKKRDIERPGAEKAHGGALDKDQYFTNRAHGGRVSDSRRVAIR
jgi:hypothetical protein